MDTGTARVPVIGSRLAHYVILRAIGAGGMGEVYEAEDTRLHRRVALKVVRCDIAADPLRRARLKREATAAARLNHPHVVTVHSLEEDVGILFITMELVDGATVADMLPPQGLSIERWLPLAIQLADALAAAHADGVVHRDLKPSNVMVSRDEAIKVLDFGLSEMKFEPARPATTTDALIAPGALAGTAAYLAPERIEGSEGDWRSDIFSLGVILFEMATGRRPFDGPSELATMTAILRDPPALANEINPAVPEALALIINRCLTKDPGRRVQSAIDLRGQLEDAARLLESVKNGRAVAEAGAPQGGGRVRPALAAAIVGVATIAVAGGFWLRGRGPQAIVGSSPGSPMTHTAIALPEDASLGSYIPAVGFESPLIGVSPDGRRLAYVAQSGPGTVLYVRELARAEFTVLRGTEGAIHPFFSPDGQWIGFLTDDKLKKVPAEGGAVATLTLVQQPLEAWWRGDAIYFSHHAGRRLSRIPEDGKGGPVPVAGAELAKALGGWDVRVSDVLPGGKSVLLTHYPKGISAEYAEIVVASSDPAEGKQLIRFGYGARYVPPGYLVFGRGGTLLAVPFDAGRLEIQGDEVPVVSGVSMESIWGQVHAAVSNNGLIAYVPGGDRAVGRLAWVDRSGRIEWLDVPPRVYGTVNLSHDGRRLAVDVADVTDYIWIYDLERRQGNRVSGLESYSTPVWNPDGRTLAFAGFSDGGILKVLVRDVDAAETPIEVVRGAWPDSWLPDGKTLAYSAARRIGFVGLDGAKQPLGLEGIWSSFSPDGKWFAFNTPAQDEIWLASYPDATVRRRIADAGKEPAWCACGELFYRWGNRWFSTRISDEPGLQWSPPHLAFETDFIDTPGVSYAIAPDGQRLLVVKRTEPDARTHLQVITNWLHEIER